MKKLLVVLALLLALCCVFAACDDKNKNDGEQNEQQTQQGGDQTGDQTGGDQTGGDQTGGGDTPVHTHAYTVQSTDAKFLASAATCKAAASYYYSCECGEKGARVFVKGTPQAHSFIVKNTKDKYLASAATCKAAASYYYSCACGEKGTETFEGDTTLEHTYVEKKTDAKYLASAATCKAAARYYYSCVCGEKGTGTFESGITLSHIRGSGLCEMCGEWIGESLVFISNGDGTCYVKGVDKGADTHLVIPDTSPIGDRVTHIAGPFHKYENLMSVTIPDSATSIGRKAFSSCRNLVNVTIGSGVIDIEEQAFSDCEKLIEVYNRSALSIVSGDWKNGGVGSNAKNVYTPTSGASKLSTTVDGYVFYVDDDTNYLMGKADAIVATTLTLPVDCNGSTYEIYKGAFYMCDKLASVTISDGVTSIGAHAFEYCRGLSDITIGNNVVSIGVYAFCECTNLSEVNFGVCGALKTIGEESFYHCAFTSVVIPNGVETIEKNAFRYCEFLAEISIPASVNYIHDTAFVSTHALERFVVDTGNAVYRSVDGVLCSKDGKLLVKYPTKQAEKQLVIPNGVTKIGKYACMGLQTITSVVIPESVLYIEQGAFDFDSKIECIYYEGTEDHWSTLSIGQSVSSTFASATRYYYSENQATSEGNFWHYVNGVATKW